ncbi:MAG: helix-turn-helix transcriptional regulator [Erysipelotrichaceae bacterium]|nr:helix-turn-helix transcriptional regulator [Erysipelotrichaceae bacterium]
MTVYRTNILPGNSVRIYEKKWSSLVNREYIEDYLKNYEGSCLVCDSKVIRDEGNGIRYVYFKDDFPSQESLGRLYNFIMNGDGSRDYYLYHQMVRELADGAEISSLPYDRETVDRIMNNREVFDSYDSQLKPQSFVLESELDYIGFQDTQNKLAAAYHDKHNLVINTGMTLYGLVRQALQVPRGDTARLSPQTAPQPKKEEYEFLYDRNKDKFFEKLASILPFSRELKKNLEEKKETFADCLFRLMREKGIQSQAELTARNGKLGVSKAVMSKWINNKDPNRTPDKATVYAIIMAARLDMKDAEALLKSANLSFGYDMEDIIVRTFISNNMYDLETLNDVVFEITHRTLLNRRDG